MNAPTVRHDELDALAPMSPLPQERSLTTLGWLSSCVDHQHDECVTAGGRAQGMEAPLSALVAV